MAKRTKRDKLAPLLKMLRAYVKPEDLQKDHKVFLQDVVIRINADKRAYKRLRTNISTHSRIRRDMSV